ncbi:MAG: SRPBCC family protein [Candidatus Kariarchaeaceae archaeon]|jgi:uncharacterized protein YndB with AHSA1/START domain
MSQELLKLNETTDDTLVFIREFAAPQELLFDVLTKAEHLAKWQSPKNMEIDAVETDLVVGGKYKLSMRSPEQGFTFELFGEYKEIDPPNKIVYTQNVPGLEPMSTITISLSQDGDMTQMVFRQSGIASKQMRDGGLKGWAPVFDRLSEYISNL